MLMDSWECETQTWTPGMERAFERLRGYPLAPWFPALVGYTVDNPETTARFLRDWRATVNDLVVKNFFGRMADLGTNADSRCRSRRERRRVPGDILGRTTSTTMCRCARFWLRARRRRRLSRFQAGPGPAFRRRGCT
jgi:hypothetical protein